MTRLGSGYVAVYDDVSQSHDVGCMWSATGLTWHACPPFAASDGVRTPLGLILESKLSNWMYYTASSHGTYDLYSENLSTTP